MGPTDEGFRVKESFFIPMYIIFLATQIIFGTVFLIHKFELRAHDLSFGMKITWIFYFIVLNKL